MISWPSSTNTPSPTWSMATSWPSARRSSPSARAALTHWTMEFALREAGAPRIFAAAFASAITKPFGKKGVFYRVAGPKVAAIDGPTDGTIPPYNRCVTLGPSDPEKSAATISAALGGQAVAIIDANDLGVIFLAPRAWSRRWLNRHSATIRSARVKNRRPWPFYAGWRDSRRQKPRRQRQRLGGFRPGREKGVRTGTTALSIQIRRKHSVKLLKQGGKTDETYTAGHPAQGIRPLHARLQGPGSRRVPR